VSQVQTEASAIGQKYRIPHPVWLLGAAIAALAAVVIAAEVVLEVQRVAALGPGWSWVVGVSALGVLAAITWLIGRELRGWLAVRRVERVREVLAHRDTSPTGKRVLTRWAHRLPDEAGACEHVAVWRQASARGDEVAAQTELDVMLCGIDTRVDIEIRREAAKTGLLVTLSGIAILDALLCTWRNIRLMRRIAAAYGGRPGMVGTIRLLRMVLLHAVAVDLTQHAADVVSTRIGAVAAAGGQGLVAATLTARLGLWTQQVCRPAPIARRSVAGFAAASAADEVAIAVRRTVERAARAFRVRPGTPAERN
jgi:putative membrane protein